MPAKVETISDGSDPIAIIIRADFNEPGVHFCTPAHFSQQLAVMRHPKGKTLDAHIHNPVPRQILYTQEVLLIRKGRIKVTLYTSLRKRLQSVELATGDLILLCGGGHAFEMLEETDMIEVKQGPYAGENDKTRFEDAGS